MKWLGHMFKSYSLPMTRVHTVFGQNCPTSSRHVTPLPSQWKVRPSTWPYGLYGQVQSAPNFDLFDSAVKSRYLLHTDSIRENKYTDGIGKTRRTQWYRFRWIPRILKIEQIFAPLVQILITPSHWKAFGPTKAYNHLSSYIKIFSTFTWILWHASHYN